MHLEIPIDKETLKKLYDTLPKGGITEISNRVKYSQAYISQFFRGGYNVTDQNRSIIDEARAIISEQAEKAAQLSKDIKESTKNS